MTAGAASLDDGSVEHEQLRRVLRLLADVLGDDLVGAYLFGSAVLGGLRPRSDLDVMVASTRHTTRAEKRALIAELLRLSGRPRYLEVTIVTTSDVGPSRSPARMDFQYGDWWREEFERGELEPWGSPTNPDLPSLVRMVLAANTPLAGPHPVEIFGEVPREDYLSSLVRGIDGLLRDVESDTVNVVLTLARVWHGALTDEIVPKDAAAEWALARLPDEHRSILSEAREIYLGERDEWSEDHLPRARSYSDHVAALVRGGPA